MLKIKDNVNLKDLEKYGFEFYERGTVEQYLIEIHDPYNPRAQLIILPITRTIIIDSNNATFIKDKLDILYKLIEDGLVEKVKEDIGDKDENNK